ncbi:MAG: PAS domain S-box protein [Candidatus Aminicenantes bacterium]|nr:PAS domain S-box protein [Candidatus Aminicenantes bacterium]
MAKNQLEELKQARERIKSLEDQIKDLSQSLKEAEVLNQILLETFPDAVTMSDLEGNIIQVSKKTLELHGLQSADEVIGKTALDLIAPQDHEKAIRNFKKTLQKGFLPSTEYVFRRKDGSTFLGELTAALIKDVAGKPKFFVATIRNTSDRKQMEVTLKESEERYRQLIESQNDGIYLLYNRKFEIINKKFSDMFNVTLDDVNDPGFDFIQLVAPQSRPLVEDRVKKAAQGIELGPKYEFTALSRNGTEIEIEAAVSYIKYKNGIGVLGIVRDISEHKKLEKQLLQAQKLEGIGRLAGGIAHDFNNLLTSIIGYIGLINMKLGSDNPCRDYVKQTLKAADRATTLVQQLLTFSRKAITNPRVINLNQVIKNFSKMLQRVLGEDIEFEFLPGENIHSIKADPVQIEQIIMNLAVNSRDAMPQGGKLIIETENCHLDKDYIQKDPYIKKGHYVLLMVSDTGSGMNEDTLSKVFEPFFTTKMEGEGTGLGLSIVYGITKQSGGHISVYSELHKGTTFKIYLPKVDKPAEKIESSTDISVFPKGNETILVVEDDNTVRDMIVDILSQSGYTVHVASSGKETLTIWDKKAGEIDLLVTDVVMPGMSGNELAKRLAQSKPQLKVLFMSGYTLSVISQYNTSGEEIYFIQKPFNVTDLTLKIREILDY